MVCVCHCLSGDSHQCAIIVFQNHVAGMEFEDCIWMHFAVVEQFGYCFGSAFGGTGFAADKALRAVSIMGLTACV